MTEHIIVLQITFVYLEMLNPIIRTFVFKCNGVFFLVNVVGIVF